MISDLSVVGVIVNISAFAAIACIKYEFKKTKLFYEHVYKRNLKLMKEIDQRLQILYEIQKQTKPEEEKRDIEIDDEDVIHISDQDMPPQKKSYYQMFTSLLFS